MFRILLISLMLFFVSNISYAAECEYIYNLESRFQSLNTMDNFFIGAAAAHYSIENNQHRSRYLAKRFAGKAAKAKFKEFAEEHIVSTGFASEGDYKKDQLKALSKGMVKGAAEI